MREARRVRGSASPRAASPNFRLPPNSLHVMPGLDPGIHVLAQANARHDGRHRRACPGDPAYGGTVLSSSGCPSQGRA
jgi:hypothetical protein